MGSLADCKLLGIFVFSGDFHAALKVMRTSNCRGLTVLRTVNCQGLTVLQTVNCQGLTVLRTVNCQGLTVLRTVNRRGFWLQWRYVRKCMKSNNWYLSFQKINNLFLFLSEKATICLFFVLKS